ncbi:MAG: gephyrin-like molybdotransferase Glp [Pseudomonadota bacterium]
MALDRLIPAEDALDIVLKDVEPVGIEQVSLLESAGKILSQDLPAKRTQPPFDASAMDGYAVRQVDLANFPASLRVIGQSRAGVPFNQKLSRNEAVRIFTGAVVPDGADTIIIQENTEANDDAVIVFSGNTTGKFIRKAGLDFNTGDILLTSGQSLLPNQIALAAAMNYDRLPVYKQPKVALLATGDELVKPGEDLHPGQIIASNTYGLHAALQNHGGSVNNLGIIGDTREALAQALKRSIDQGADLIITTGGASVGDHDLVLPVAQEMGFKFEISKIAMRPGKPFLFGKFSTGEKTVYLTGLAGNPVSSLVAYMVFVRPLLQRLSGQPAGALNRVRAMLGCDLAENDERAEYMRAQLSHSDDGSLVATPFLKQDSSMLANMVKADCLVYRPVLAQAAIKGDPCEIVFINH